MKKLMFSILFLGSIALVNAQTEVIKTTEVKSKPEVTENGVVYNTKVKVVTEKTKNTMFDPAQKHKLNQDLVETPVAVTKTVMVDNDVDPFYDEKTKVVYYTLNGKKYGFYVDDNRKDFKISYTMNEKDINSARAMRSQNKNYYLVKGSEFNGVGYFDTNSNFVIEYYDEKSNTLEVAVFDTFKM
ncbi:hypothetical protein [Tenacibaculum sp. IB213877]|uniref:hypothetical protein n=1 Tax=Tenacibaculum sp. IB213877 TaxID=3097351 RepID=UPI002A5A3AF4|nr:hypothetical protein [Tenacibaculum sp. IB213877]MDY0779530.1 hypothetical protein [Tenacibaculum sp. IB213877]